MRPHDKLFATYLDRIAQSQHKNQLRFASAAGPDESLRVASKPHEIHSLFVSVTQFCNLTCTYCSADAGPQRTASLEVNAATASVRRWIELAAIRKLTLIFTGGEPTAWGYRNLSAVCEICGQTARHVK